MPRKSTILAVDDIPANLIAIEAVLDSDFTLVFASSGPEAIEILQVRSDIDVILMDLQMPTMDGFEAAERIKLLPNCRDIPIVFITALYREDPHVKRGYQSGGVDYFTKPFDPDLLKLKMGIYASFRQKAAVLKEREDHLQATEELVKAGRKLSAVLESLPVGILIADINGRVCQSNDEVSRICKTTEAIEHGAYGEMLGWWTAGGEQLKDPEGPLARALQSGQSSHSAPIVIRCFDGTPKLIVASASPLFGTSGQVVGAVIVIKDVTESKQIEEELQTRVANLVSMGIAIEESIRPIS
ncbi:MAG: response regulator [Myxococcota bacterium]|nr:response regulator [Deltaproteobacteria bacterium]MDQ3337736.1 response regulator [Myxococcota bacterium]